MPMRSFSTFATGTTPDKISEHYTKLGGANSTLGAPSGGVYPVANGWAQNYTSGTIYYSPATGAWALRGPILTKYQQLGGPAGPTGFPIGDSNPCGDGVGQFAHFANNASIFHHPNTSAHAVYGLIRQKWAGMGWERSTLGYPTNDEDGTPDGIGRFNHFANGGSIYYTPTTGAHWINGLIKARWAQLGWERSYLHYPTTDEYVITGGWRNDFQGGYIYYTSGPAAVDHPW